MGSLSVVMFEINEEAMDADAEMEKLKVGLRQLVEILNLDYMFTGYIWAVEMFGSLSLLSSHTHTH